MAGRAGCQVLDSHLHLFTAETRREEEAWRPAMSPGVAAAARGRQEREAFIRSRGQS
jgi:hypothetical protein